MNNSKLKNGVQIPKGVDTDRSQSNLEAGVTNSPLGCKLEALSEEHSAWMRQQKSLHNLTEHALRKKQPLIIVNMMHDKAHLLSAEDLTGNLKVEQMCLPALSMRVFPGCLSIEVPSDSNLQEENQDACILNGKGSTVATGVASTISDFDLPKIVSVIQSCPQGINRVLESLQQSFPEILKSQLKYKICEISEFIDNRWKVKRRSWLSWGCQAHQDAENDENGYKTPMKNADYNGSNDYSKVNRPKVGMVFGSWDDVDRYFRSYGKQEGFGVARYSATLSYMFW